MPVRNPVKSGGGLRGYFSSNKMNTQIAFESLLECNFCFYLEFLKDVKYFEEQPLKIPYTYMGKNKNYYPDFKIILSNGDHWLVECKFSGRINDEKNQIKFDIGNQWCENNNYHYAIITEKEIQQNPLLNNLILLDSKKNFIIANDFDKKIIDLLNVNSTKFLTINALCFEFNKEERTTIRSILLRLLFEERIISELHEKAINGESILIPRNDMQKGFIYEFTSIFNW